MNKNKNKSYVLYIKGVEAFEKYKIPNVELMETKKFTDKQLANIAKGDMFLLSRQYNQKLWKMLKKEFGNKTNVCDIWIDSSIANLSFELFDKNQNLHTFKVHTEDSVLDFKVFKTKKEIGRGNSVPFFFLDSFTGPGIISATEDNLDIKEEKNGELVIIIQSELIGANDYVRVIYKTKNELDTDEKLKNYRTKLINPESHLFSLIKVLAKENLLAFASHLTNEQISNINDMYVPAHTIGLHYKIGEDSRIDFIFSYSNKSFNRLENTLKNKYFAFSDFISKEEK